MALEQLALVGGDCNFQKGSFLTRRSTESNGTCSALSTASLNSTATTPIRMSCGNCWPSGLGHRQSGRQGRRDPRHPIMHGEEPFLCLHLFKDGAPSVVAQLAESAKTKGETILSPNHREEAHSHERAHDGYRRRFHALEGAHRRFQHGK